MAGLHGLLVEDQSMFLELLLPVLEGIPGLTMVGTATTAGEAIRAVQQLQPDLLILDLRLPDRPGIEVAESLRRLRPQAHLIVLSGQASSFLCPPELQPMLHAVVDKTSAFRELRHEINQLLGSLPQAIRPQRKAAGQAGPAAETDSGLAPAPLTQRERDVLALIAQGCSSRAIAETLGMAETTVQTHRRSLRMKLGVSGSGLVRLAVLQNHGS
jgi:DNA-binding NarL/FixJ family response regulator